MANTFRALTLTQDDNRKTQSQFEQIAFDDLPDGDVFVKIQYSSLNYKDGLAVTGKGRVVRQFPMIPGIDFVGTVRESSSENYKAGDAVVLTGWGVGEKHWGGYAEYARVSSEWLVPLPDGLTPEDSMAIGTAGFTAMMCIIALESHDVRPHSGEILVTGASGGAGSVAIAILGSLGYTIVASTGRQEQADYLKSLGANEVIGRLEAPARPLDSERWAGAIDAVGGDTLANIIATTQYGGCVTAYGLAGGTDLNTTVFPFILRSVNLLGIDSVMCPQPYRTQVWERLAENLSADTIAQVKQLELLSSVPKLAEQIIAGQIRGRVVIDVNA